MSLKFTISQNLFGRKYFLSILILFFAGIAHSSSQEVNTSFEELTLQLDSLTQNHPTELIYLQSSKNIYETGEDLWFKAYVLDAQLLGQWVDGFFRL